MQAKADVERIIEGKPSDGRANVTISDSRSTLRDCCPGSADKPGMQQCLDHFIQRPTMGKYKARGEEA